MCQIGHEEHYEGGIQYGKRHRKSVESVSILELCDGKHCLTGNNVICFC